MGWVSSEPCSHSVTLKDSDLHRLFVPLRCLLSDPQWDPVIMWHRSSAVASIWVIGMLHPVFYLGTGLKKVANLPLLKATWTHSVFHWYNYLATIFFPSIGLEVIITHIEALTKFSQQVLNGSWQNLSFLSTESNEKSNHLKQDGLDIITALQGNACDIIQRVVFLYLRSLLVYHFIKSHEDTMALVSWCQA